MKEVKEKIIKIFSDVSGLNLSDFDSDLTFTEIGMDSLLLTRIALSLKKEFSIETSLRLLLGDASSLDTLSTFIISNIDSSFTDTDTEALVPDPKEPNNSLESVQKLISRQLEIMQNQLILLSENCGTHNFSSDEKVLFENNEIVKTVELRIQKLQQMADASYKKSNYSFTSEQLDYIHELLAGYMNKTASSRLYSQRVKERYAVALTDSNKISLAIDAQYSIVINKSKDNNLWDIDDNKYIDITCGDGSNFFGNAHPHIVKYMKAQIDSGSEVGYQHPLVEDVVRLVCEVSGAERAGVYESESEALLACVAMAKTVSGKVQIINFSDTELKLNEGVIKLEYGNQESFDYVNEHIHEIAGIIIEPVQRKRCGYHPKEFIKNLRDITRAHNVCLIFDEIISGFRISKGGAQEYFDIEADLAVYGRVIGAGMPIGIVAGREQYLGAYDGADTTSSSLNTLYRDVANHPLVLAAAKGSLEIIRDGGEELYDNINTKADVFVAKLNLFCKLSNIPLTIDNFGTLMMPKWLVDVPASDIFYISLRDSGVYVLDGQPWYLNIAHTSEDLKIVLQIIQEHLLLFQSKGLIPRLEENDKSVTPVDGSQLMQDENGDVDWFIKNRNGIYEKVEEGN